MTSSFTYKWVFWDFHCLPTTEPLPRSPWDVCVYGMRDAPVLCVNCSDLCTITHFSGLRCDCKGSLGIGLKHCASAIIHLRWCDLWWTNFKLTEQLQTSKRKDTSHWFQSRSAHISPHTDSDCDKWHLGTGYLTHTFWNLTLCFEARRPTIPLVWPVWRPIHWLFSVVVCH